MAPYYDCSVPTQSQSKKSGDSLEEEEEEEEEEESPFPSPCGPPGPAVAASSTFHLVQQLDVGVRGYGGAALHSA
jgi:hypothetical protein